MSGASPDRAAAWATAAGIGLMTLMVTWLVGSRLAGLVWDPPLGPTVALSGATLIGLGVGVLSGRRLVSQTGRRHRSVHVFGEDRRRSRQVG